MTRLPYEPLLKTVGRLGLVLLMIVALFVLSIFPFHVASLGEIRPAFLLIAVYYWAILHPSLLPPLAVFAIGIALDLLFVYPLGMNALVLVVVQWLTRSQRKFLLGQSFPVIWAGFALVVFGAGILQWGLFSLFNTTLVPVKPMLVSAALSTFLFPLMAVPLSLLHKALVDSPSSMP